MPIAGLVALASAAFAAALRQPRESARLLGAAARLRGVDDPTQPDVVRISTGLRADLGSTGIPPPGTRDGASTAMWLHAVDPAHLLATQVRRA